MDPEAPRPPGDPAEARAERKAPTAKKSLEQFLLEFEARLRDHPSAPATSATAAVERRAEGSSRTTVESSPGTARKAGPAATGMKPPRGEPAPEPAGASKRRPRQRRRRRGR